jgi:uncharacterized cysteine cluster protein YcgN (CxxCxxCC family)
MADALNKLRDRRLRKFAAFLDNGRSCDGCDLCCTAVGVTVLNKPPAVACKHLCGEPGRSCSIYERRPKDCREFFCFWRAAPQVLDDRFRPVECGFVVAINDASDYPVVITVHPDPARPDAWKAFRPAFAQLAHEQDCIVAVGQGRTATDIFAPQGFHATKAEAPSLFVDGGLKVGAPDFLFKRFQKGGPQ